MRSAPTAPLDREEPTDAAVRVGLGLRPAYYDLDEDTIDPRPCPAWCFYGQNRDKHEIHAEHPFDAFHTVGTGADVVLSRYEAERFPRTDMQEGHFDVATLHVDVAQRGQGEPDIEVRFRVDGYSAFEIETNGLRLSVVDAKELATPLTYFVDVLEGRRMPIEGSQ